MSLIGIIASSRLSDAIPVEGYSLWLDGDDASIFSFSSGTVVSQWNDKSGNAYNFIQPTVANQPNRNSTQNGKTGLTFQGDWMYNSSFDWSNSAFTVFVVMKYDLAATNFSGIFGAGALSSVSLSVSSDDAFATFKVGVSASTYNLFPTGSNADVAVWKSAGNSGSMTTTFYKNGTAASSTTTMTGLSTGTQAFLGASADNTDVSPSINPEEFIYEVIVYPSQLSDGDRNSVEAYLKTKWGTP